MSAEIFACTTFQFLVAVSPIDLICWFTFSIGPNDKSTPPEACRIEIDLSIQEMIGAVFHKRLAF
jgi:hypothetical protein